MKKKKARYPDGPRAGEQVVTRTVPRRLGGTIGGLDQALLKYKMGDRTPQGLPKTPSFEVSDNGSRLKNIIKNIKKTFKNR